MNGDPRLGDAGVKQCLVYFDHLNAAAITGMCGSQFPSGPFVIKNQGHSQVEVYKGLGFYGHRVAGHLHREIDGIDLPASRREFVAEVEYDLSELKSGLWSFIVVSDKLGDDEDETSGLVLNLDGVPLNLEFPIFAISQLITSFRHVTDEVSSFISPDEAGALMYLAAVVHGLPVAYPRPLVEMVKKNNLTSMVVDAVLGGFVAGDILETLTCR